MAINRKGLLSDIIYDLRSAGVDVKDTDIIYSICIEGNSLSISLDRDEVSIQMNAYLDPTALQPPF